MTATIERNLPTPNRTFVPSDLDSAQWEQLDPLYQDLLGRPVDTADQLQAWLTDYSELSAAVGEYGSLRNIDYACHTDRDDIEKAYMHWVENIAPKLSPIANQLREKYLAAPGLSGLDESRYGILTREWKASSELFREANVPLDTKITKLNSDYDKTIGEMQVDFDGKTQTLQQLARYQEETDRSVREEAFRLSA
ncbi:MAG: hypothetical protein V3V20_02545, partial [Algisphaera sp.]